jgi:hypothetical protein
MSRRILATPNFCQKLQPQTPKPVIPTEASRRFLLVRPNLSFRPKRADAFLLVRPTCHSDQTEPTLFFSLAQTCHSDQTEPTLFLLVRPANESARAVEESPCFAGWTGLSRKISVGRAGIGPAQRSVCFRVHRQSAGPRVPHRSRRRKLQSHARIAEEYPRPAHVRVRDPTLCRENGGPQ